MPPMNPVSVLTLEDGAVSFLAALLANGLVNILSLTRSNAVYSHLLGDSSAKQGARVNATTLKVITYLAVGTPTQQPSDCIVVGCSTGEVIVYDLNQEATLSVFNVSGPVSALAATSYMDSIPRKEQGADLPRDTLVYASSGLFVHAFSLLQREEAFWVVTGDEVQHLFSIYADNTRDNSLFVVISADKYARLFSSADLLFELPLCVAVEFATCLGRYILCQGIDSSLSLLHMSDQAITLIYTSAPDPLTLAARLLFKPPAKPVISSQDMASYISKHESLQKAFDRTIESTFGTSPDGDSHSCGLPFLLRVSDDAFSITMLNINAQGRGKRDLLELVIHRQYLDSMGRILGASTFYDSSGCRFALRDSANKVSIYSHPLADNILAYLDYYDVPCMARKPAKLSFVKCIQDVFTAKAEYYLLLQRKAFLQQALDKDSVTDEADFLFPDLLRDMGLDSALAALQNGSSSPPKIEPKGGALHIHIAHLGFDNVSVCSIVGQEGQSCNHEVIFPEFEEADALALFFNGGFIKGNSIASPLERTVNNISLESYNSDFSMLFELSQTHTLSEICSAPELRSYVLAKLGVMRQPISLLCPPLSQKNRPSFNYSGFLSYVPNEYNSVPLTFSMRVNYAMGLAASTSYGASVPIQLTLPCLPYIDILPEFLPHQPSDFPSSITADIKASDVNLPFFTLKSVLLSGLLTSNSQELSELSINTDLLSYIDTSYQQGHPSKPPVLNLKATLDGTAVTSITCTSTNILLLLRYLYSLCMHIDKTKKLLSYITLSIGTDTKAIIKETFERLESNVAQHSAATIKISELGAALTFGTSSVVSNISACQYNAAKANLEEVQTGARFVIDTNFKRYVSQKASERCVKYLNDIADIMGTLRLETRSPLRLAVTAKAFNDFVIGLELH